MFIVFLSKLSLFPKDLHTSWDLSRCCIGMVAAEIRLSAADSLQKPTTGDKTKSHWSSYVLVPSSSPICGPEDAQRRVFRRRSLPPLLFTRRAGRLGQCVPIQTSPRHRRPHITEDPMCGTGWATSYTSRIPQTITHLNGYGCKTGLLTVSSS